MARPKSEITSRPSLIRSTFCGVTSRWMMPTAWIAASPAQRARASTRRSASGRRVRASARRAAAAAAPIAGGQLHGDEPVPVGVAELEHPADVGVADGARHLHLAREPLDPALLAGARPALQDLDRDRLPQHTVPGAKHLAAAPFADDRLDLVAGVEHGARLERRHGLDAQRHAVD